MLLIPTIVKYIATIFFLSLCVLSPSFLNAQIIFTVAGGGAASVDDGTPATSVHLTDPYGIGIDDSGNLFISEGSQHIRKVTPSGIITTICGNGLSGYSGDGGPAINASIWGWVDFAFDKSGNVFIADEGNNCIRKINQSGIISCVVGTQLLLVIQVTPEQLRQQR